MRRYLIWLLLLSSTPLLNAASRWDFIRQIGGTESEDVAGIARDKAGNIFVAGTTHSQDFPADGHQTLPTAASLYRITGDAEWEPLYSHKAAKVWSLAPDWTRPGTLYALSSRGLLKTTDHATTWQALPTGWPADATVEHISVQPGNGDVLFAASRSHGIYRSLDAGQTWQLVLEAGFGFIPNRLVFNPHNPSTLFAFNSIEVLPVYRSDDGGDTWHSGRQFSAVVYDPSTPDLVYGATFGAVWRSRDGGSSWEWITDINHFRSVTVDSAGRLYVQETLDDLLRVTTDQGETWDSIRLDGRKIHQVASDPNSPVIFAAAGDWRERETIRSTDGFDTWTAAGPWLPSLSHALVIAPGPAGAPDLYATGSAFTDGFIVKLDPDGRPLWSTYLGSTGDDVIVAVDVDDSGNVYVAGQGGWEDFPLTPGSYRASEVAGVLTGSFVSKFSPGGEMVFSAQVVNPRSRVRKMAVDPAGNVYVTGNSFGGIETTPGVVRPQPLLGAETDPGPQSRRIFSWPPPNQDRFVLKLNSSGSHVDYATYLGVRSYSYSEPDAAPIDVDAGGHAYVAVPNAVEGRGTLLVKLSPDATSYEYNTAIGSAQARALQVRDDGELFVVGRTDEPDFFTTPGAFQRTTGYYGREVGERVAAGKTDTFVARMSADGNTILRSTRLGGEADDFPRALAIDPGGNPVLGGATWSRGFPTREPLQGAFSRGTGFVARFDGELSKLEFSTYAGDRRHFEVAGVTTDDDGNVIFAGYTLEPRPNQFPDFLEPASSSDIFVVKLKPIYTLRRWRLDSVTNAASHLAGPLAPGEIIELRGLWFADAFVYVNGELLTNLSVTENRILAIVPDDVDQEEQARVLVRSAGRESNIILMPTAPGSPGIVTVDGSGHGQGFILNEDGTLNSESNRAAPGSTVTIAVNGIGRTFSAWGQTWPETEESVRIGGWWTPVVGGELRDLPDFPGQVLLLQVPVPDPQLPHAPEFKIPDRVAVNIESGGQLSQPGVAIHLTIR